MDARRVTDEVSVSPQIAVADVAEIAAAGYRAIVCNRPDNEQAAQVPVGDIEAAALAAGLAFVAQPVASGAVTDGDGERFGEIVASLPQPVLAYCRSGTRCTMLWALSQAKARPLDEIVQKAAHAGYDLSALKPRLAAIKAQQA